MDLRAEVEDGCEELIEALKDDFRQADLSPGDRALLDACVKLTQSPATMTGADCDELRRRGFDDEAIHDAFQTAAYFNYINRVCDGLGIDLEDFMPPKKECESASG